MSGAPDTPVPESGERDIAEQAVRRFLMDLAQSRLPCVILVGLPATGETMRSGNGLDNPHMRRMFASELAVFFEFIEKNAPKTHEAHECPVMEMKLEFKDCPVCLRSGVQPGGSEQDQKPCEMCSGRGRVLV